MKEFSRFNGGLHDIHKTMADPFWKVLAVVCFENRGFLSRTGVCCNEIYLPGADIRVPTVPTSSGFQRYTDESDKNCVWTLL